MAKITVGFCKRDVDRYAAVIYLSPHFPRAICIPGSENVLNKSVLLNNSGVFCEHSEIEKKKFCAEKDL